MNCPRRLLLNLVGLCLLCLLCLPSRLPAGEYPPFAIRGRVTRSKDADVAAEPDFTVSLALPRANAVKTAGNAWSRWLAVDAEGVAAARKMYPNDYLKGRLLVVKLNFGGIAEPAAVEAELVFGKPGTPMVNDAGEPIGDRVRLTGRLFGPTLGIVVSIEDGKPQAATMAQYNQRYWQILQTVNLPADRRPQRFPIVDRFIGGDQDLDAWKEGIERLNRGGFSAMMLPPDARYRQMLLDAGGRRTAWAVYNPPGYAFDHSPGVTTDAIVTWARKQADPYMKAGYDREDMAIFAMSDEPGWYYPAQFKSVTDNPEVLARFREYLENQGLQPAELGAKSWEEILPLGRSQAKDLPSKRLFYWTMRFFPWDSARHFARCTNALETVFYADLPVYTNWNFFAGRLYVPGPVANNRDKQSPDAAMGGHDWFEFGRRRGCTMLWTEDWFGDEQAYQWSFYCAKLRCAARPRGIRFGAYVIPRTAGSREDGILQKILCVAGSGGKAIKYFVFGPEYNFPGNCYSFKSQLLPKMAEAHGLIGAAEDLLVPGQRPRPAVAILMPRSAQLWDARDLAVPTQVWDATNTDLNRGTVDYMAEIFDLYLALQHANIPTDFISEDDLDNESLKPYRVIYVTEPDIPADGLRGLLDWAAGGGTLVTVTGAAAFDRYHEPLALLAEASGFTEAVRERLLVPSLAKVPVGGRIRDGDQEFNVIGPVGQLAEVPAGAQVLLKFADGRAALIAVAIGKGQRVHFAFMPGMSYFRSATGRQDKLPVGFSEALRRRIIQPVTDAAVSMPVTVNVPMVETPMLVSQAGWAVTLLNWNGVPIPELQVAVELPPGRVQVTSARLGELKAERRDGKLLMTLPLGAADILMLRPAAE